ncbi:MAG: xanthine dehydrogenase family protein molybdopterin-binding subunit [Vallitaleaceae bacterium]|jgi:CO/xanthine dehydrogenase Mo-binding subunit|nr:xanthine dehydrogenase family protein molybdopterin-binding subunit [Vallitaleaceae bacterium]
MSDISRSINKVDNDEKITGKAVYIDDIKLENMLYAKTVRAEITSGTIIGRHYPEMPTDYHIVDYLDIPGNNYVKIIFEDMPVFVKDKVGYYGEPIALVVGPDKQVILDIISQIVFEYDAIAPIYDYVDSVIHYDYEKGVGEAVFEPANRVIEYTYETGYQEHVYIEPQGVIGDTDGDKISVYGSIQCPYYVKNALINTLGMDEKKVRVVQTTTGGAFGGKEEFPSLIACQVAVAVKKIGKPIKLIYNRVEDMAYTTKRHPSTIRMEAAIDEQNNILGFRAHVSLDGGANIGLSSVVLQRAMIAATGVYNINNLAISGDVYRTNTVPTGAFRGFGAPQMIFAVEMFIHHIAKELGIDPLILRNKYMAKQGDSTSTSGHFRDPIIMKDMIARAKELADYDHKIKLYGEHMPTKDMPGIGMSWFLHGCGFTGSGEQKHIKAVVRLHKDVGDIVTVLVAAVDMGQGIKTTMRKLVAHVLELPIEQVIMHNPDTDLVPDSGPTVASRTLMIVGALVSQAAEKLKENWLAGKEQIFEEKYKQPKYIQWDEESFQGNAYPGYSWGVNIVEVAVSPVTYEVTLKGTWSVYDVGKAIDERIIMGQADGGLLQGISYGMLEVMENKDGMVQQKTVTDYIIPTASDTVNMITELMDNPFELGPFGAKGAGELTLIGGAPAVALAIENAIGKSVTKIPVTPEYIMSLIEGE